MLEPRVLETRLSLKKHTTKLQNISEYNVKITFFLFPPYYVLFKKASLPILKSDECEKVKGQLSYIVQEMKEEQQQSRSRGFHM